MLAANAASSAHHTHACEVTLLVTWCEHSSEGRKHEETDLAWRAADAGWTILYAPELLLQHPKTSPARHAVYHRVTARNRVWLVRRRLPLPLIPVHLGVWIAVTLLRTRSVGGLKAWFGGFVEGLRTSGGERRPMRWRTVWRLTRLGRPPVL